jgi:predicted amidohydrolase
MVGSRESIRLAVVQPEPLAPPRDADNVVAAVAAVRRCAASGAELVLFPEGYPGPLRAASSYDAAPALAQAARESACAVCWSRVERGDDRRHHKVVYLHGPDGEVALRYVRSHPATGDVHPTLSGVSLAPGPALATVDVCGVHVGVLVCSELWLPEIARVLAVRGAEVLLAPAGGGFGNVAENWRLIARARAIENQCYVGLTQSRFDGEAGSALIAGPEGVAAAGEGEDVVADLDLERVRWLRAADDSMANPKPFRSLPGLLRARRPGLYAELTSDREGLYDYEAAVA